MNDPIIENIDFMQFNLLIVAEIFQLSNESQAVNSISKLRESFILV